MEAQVALVAELQDFFRKRAELELDYSKSLDKMAKSLQMRHKEQKQKWVIRKNVTFILKHWKLVIRVYAIRKSLSMLKNAK